MGEITSLVELKTYANAFSLTPEVLLKRCNNFFHTAESESINCCLVGWRERRVEFDLIALENSKRKAGNTFFAAVNGPVSAFYQYLIDILINGDNFFIQFDFEMSRSFGKEVRIAPNGQKIRILHSKIIIQAPLRS